MMNRFGLDVIEPVDTDPGFLKPTSWTEERGYSFFLPPGVVEAVYGDERWPIGS
jgi:hypothetical protein